MSDYYDNPYPNDSGNRLVYDYWKLEKEVAELKEKLRLAEEVIELLVNDTEWVEDTVINWQDKARAALEKIRGGK